MLLFLTLNKSLSGLATRLIVYLIRLDESLSEQLLVFSKSALKLLFENLTYLKLLRSRMVSS